MVNVTKIIEQKMRQINKIVEAGCRTILGERIKKILVYNIQESFYSLGYGDGHDLWDSITVNVSPMNNGFMIEVYFDADKISHTSWFGSNSLNISANTQVYTIDWINKGQSFVHGSTSVRLKDVGKAPQFIEKTIEDIQSDNTLLNDFNSYLRKNGIDVK